MILRTRDRSETTNEGYVEGIQNRARVTELPKKTNPKESVKKTQKTKCKQVTENDKKQTPKEPTKRVKRHTANRPKKDITKGPKTTNKTHLTDQK